MGREKESTIFILIILYNYILLWLFIKSGFYRKWQVFFKPDFSLVITIIIYNLKYVEPVVSKKALGICKLEPNRQTTKSPPYSYARSWYSFQWTGDLGTKWSLSWHCHFCRVFPSECLILDKLTSMVITAQFIRIKLRSELRKMQDVVGCFKISQIWTLWISLIQSIPYYTRNTTSNVLIQLLSRF